MDLALHRALEAIRHACDPTPPWSDILEASRQVLGGDSATFVLFEDRQLLAAEHVGVDAAAIRDYVQHFHSHDILLRAGPARPAGTWLDTLTILRRERERCAHYHTDFMCRHRMRQMVCLVVEETESGSAAITVHRSEVRDDAQERARSESVASYRRAVHEAFAARRTQAARLLQGSALSLDDFGHAGCLVSGRGQVLWASQAGQALFDRSSLRIRQGRWWHADAKTREALAGGLLRSTVPDRAGGPPVRVVVPEEAGGGCLVLEMVRADPRLRWAHETAVFVRMETRRPMQRVPVEALCHAFRISPAEARVLGALMNGETLADHALSHGVSIHTVRKQIANLREKMGCTRQVDMVRLALAVV